MGLALLTCVGVRFLTAGCSGLSEGNVISNGVAAGCVQGNHAARLVLYDILEKSHELHPATTTSQWADDLAQRTQAPPSEVVNKTVEAALQLVRDLQEDRLAAASKSVVIATTPLVAKQVVCSLARHDLHIQEASQAKDLGLDVSSARKPVRRPWPRDGSRREDERGGTGDLANGPRSKPVHAFGGREHGRRETYGTAAVGAPPTWIKQARTRAAEAAQCGGRGRCLTTTIALLRLDADPAVQIPCNLIRQRLIFCSNCNSDDGEETNNQMEVCAGAHVCSHRWTLATKLDPHSTHFLERPRRQQMDSSRQEVWEFMIGDFGKPSKLRLRCSCGRRPRDTSWEQVWGWRGGPHNVVQARQAPGEKGPARNPRNAPGRGNGVVLDTGATLSCRAGGTAALPEVRGRGRGHASSSLAMQSRHR